MNYLDLAWLASPEIILVATALAVLAVGLVRQRPLGFCLGLAVAGILFAMAAVLALPRSAGFAQGMIVITPANSLLQFICLALTLSALLLESGRSLGNHGEFLALFLFGAVGLLLLVGSEELLMIFIGLELLGLSLYLLTAFDKTRQESAEAGLKYFLFGSVASAFTLFGISLIYGMSGETSLAGIAAQLRAVHAQPLLAAGVVMTLIGFAFKIAAAPFHFWVADTYEAAPIASAGFIASGSKVASFVVLGKIVLFGFAPLAGAAAWHAAAAGWKPVLALLAAASILLGNLLALAQKNVRRLLAYSAVAHSGYALLGIVAGIEGFAATLFYISVYAATLVGAFGVVGLVRRETGGDGLTNFAGLRKRSPVLAAAMAIFLLSLGGLPPLPGFFGKFYLFRAAMQATPQLGLTWLVALALFGSLISLYYYLVVLQAIFLDEPGAIRPPLARENFRLTKWTVSVLAFTIFLLGIFPGALVSLISESLR